MNLSDAGKQGFEASSILENPYWVNYPNPAIGGAIEECAARQFVDGYIEKLKEECQKHDPIRTK